MCEREDKLVVSTLTSLINKIQSNYEEDITGDKLICKLCGGTYTRRKKSMHHKSRRHRAKIAKAVTISYGDFSISMSH